MPPKEKEAKKSVSFKGTETSKKDSSRACGVSPDADQKIVSSDAPSLVGPVSAPAFPSDGASQSFDVKVPGESLDNEGFVPPLEQREYRPSGDDRQVVTVDDGDGQQNSRGGEVVDIDELPVDDDGYGMPGSSICACPQHIFQVGRTFLCASRASQYICCQRTRALRYG